MNDVVGLAGAITGITGAFVIVYKCITWFNRIVEGIRCSLRSDILNIYYECVETRTISQYKAEHFEKCYYAYKALHGNSFIDEIHEQGKEWKVVA